MATSVRIATDNINCLATMHRSDLNGLIASVRMKDTKRFKKYKKQLLDSLEDLFKVTDSYMDQSGNPAQG